jgi:hypothetical protein
MILEDFTLFCSTVAGLVLAWIAGEFLIKKYRKWKGKKVKNELAEF